MNIPSKTQVSDLVFHQIKSTSSINLEFFQIYKNQKGTRFTLAGYEVAKKLWTFYPIKLKDNYKILNRTLLLLDSRMNWPYYLSKSQLVLFNEMDAFEFTLYQGDINLWSIK